MNVPVKRLKLKKKFKFGNTPKKISSPKVKGGLIFFANKGKIRFTFSAFWGTIGQGEYIR